MLQNKDPITERHLRPIAAELDWEVQRGMWAGGQGRGADGRGLRLRARACRLQVERKWLPVPEHVEWSRPAARAHSAEAAWPFPASPPLAQLRTTVKVLAALRFKGNVPL